MARVLLIQPPLWPHELYARGSNTSASLIPPLGLAYIAAYLRAHSHECMIIDGIAGPEPLEELAQRAHEYDVVGVTAVSTYAVRAIELIQALKRAVPGVRVAAGGPHTTVLPESMLDAGADYAIIGEGEATMLALVEALAAGATGEGVTGLAHRLSGETTYTGVRPLIEPLDQIPLPARDLLPMHRYRSSIARATQQPSHSMLASRGCPGACTFCNKKTFGTQVRYFSPERIVEEFLLLRDTYGARDIAVWDDNFVANADVVHAVCEELSRRDFGLSWSVEARIDGIDRTILKALKQAGCTYIAYGIESGSPRILEHINKRVTKEQVREVVRMTQETGLAIRGYFMLGFPTETPEDMEATIRFAMELDIELASFTLFVPLPGTPEYRRALEGGSFPDPEYYLHRILPEFNFPDSPLYVPEGMTAAELLSIHRGAYNRYYFRPKRLFRSLMAVRSPGQVASMAQGGLTLLRNAICRK